MNTPVDSADAQASDLLDAMYLTMRRLRREGFHSAAMSYADLMILGHVQKSPGRGVSDLATEAGVSGPTMSGQIKRLEAAGMILREPGPDNDRRRVSLILSPSAEAMMNSLRRQGTEWMAARLAELTDAERETLAKAVPVLRAIAGGAPTREDDASR
jgi:DNA-binding MarR family transcriptional regulator